MQSSPEHLKISQRLWSRDATLWTNDALEQSAIADRLGWLDAPAWLRCQQEQLVNFADEVWEAGFKKVVLLGMGGSSLAAEVLARTFDIVPPGLALVVLDNTHPDAVGAVLGSEDLERTLFIVASKSGTTLEANVFLATFLAALRRRVGARAGRHFVAITDEDTPLARRAAEEGFRYCFINPGDIGGRYSALTYFGMVPAALLGLDLERLAAAADLAVSAARKADSSALTLGLFLGHWDANGRDKLCVLLSGGLAALSVWIEQLIAESTGKRGIGIVPVEDALLSPEAYSDDLMFVAVTLSEDAELSKRCRRLEAAGYPVQCHTITTKAALAGEFFRWEFATAVAGAVLGINPFDEPDVTVSKQMTTALLQGTAESTSQEWSLLIDDAGFQVYGHRSSGADSGALATALGGFLEDVRSGDYLVVLPYLPAKPAYKSAIETLAVALRERVEVPVTVNFGPRYLHSTGQLHKGGASSGVYVIVTMCSDADIAIPGEDFGFSKLNLAQAEGDYRVLASLERRVMRIHLLQSDTVANLPGQLLDETARGQ